MNSVYKCHQKNPVFIRSSIPWFLLLLYGAVLSFIREELDSVQTWMGGIHVLNSHSHSVHTFRAVDSEVSSHHELRTNSIRKQEPDTANTY
jgi:hypothetical protein